jgi:hypothetical protein
MIVPFFRAGAICEGSGGHVSGVSGGGDGEADGVHYS